MPNHLSLSSILPIAAGVAVAAGWATYTLWLRSLEAALDARSRVVQTPYGDIEYAEEGSGPPILITHGILGGWDQGMLVTHLADPPQRPFRIISVSRWGYMRTPIPRDPAMRTHEAQVDSYAALLDTLGVDKVAMVGISGGGPSAIQFALRHPDRCWALVSIAGVTRPIITNFTRTERILLPIVNNDLGLWLIRKFAEDRILSFYGATPEVLERFAGQPEKLAVLKAVYFPHPLEGRRAGFALDMEGFPVIPRYPVEQIAVPTLAVHGTADGTVPISHSQFLVDNVPGARLLSIEGAGHLAIATHKEIAVAGVLDFLRAVDRTS
ncbi:MAG TPA: alpha/beta hydrolase [Chloroflexia bacterium]|nr:alpha/beta hydrolase [Chloroflexia bacterium]